MHFVLRVDPADEALLLLSLLLRVNKRCATTSTVFLSVDCFLQMNWRCCSRCGCRFFWGGMLMAELDCFCRLSVCMSSLLLRWSLLLLLLLPAPFADVKVLLKLMLMLCALSSVSFALLPPLQHRKRCCFVHDLVAVDGSKSSLRGCAIGCNDENTHHLCRCAPK